MQKNYTIFWICGLVLAAAVGFFASSVLFCHERALPPAPPKAMEQVQDEQPPQKWQGLKVQKGKNIMHMMDSALGLSEDQIKNLHENGHKRDSIHRAIHHQIKETEGQLHKLLGEDQIDEAALKSTRAKLLLLNENRLDQRIEDVRLFKKLLSAEQLKKFSELKPIFDKKAPRGEKEKFPDTLLDEPNHDHMGPPHRDGAHKMPPRQ
ncbi:MAG: hypothetical protein J6Z31_05160 [Fibrobacter sp.]|nr:hypothetical protein [Fibrobacter sp.]